MRVDETLGLAHSIGDDNPLAGPDGIIDGTPVHQYIAQEAFMAFEKADKEILNLLPNSLKEEFEEFKNHVIVDIYFTIDRICDVNFDSNNNIITGSGEEDNQSNPFMCNVTDPKEYCSGDGLNGYYEHFWDPDEPKYGGFNCNQIGGGYNRGLRNILVGEPVAKTDGEKYWDSNYRLAQYYWDQKIIPEYLKGYKNEVYYWLGRVVHLLTDLTVPAHVHDDVHAFGYGDDSFESDIKDNIKSPLFTYKGTNYDDICRVEKIAEKISNIKFGFEWQDVHDQKDPPNLFKLFWYTAQKTQYFASDGVDGDKGKFVKWNGEEDYFEKDEAGQPQLPGLWKGEIQGTDIVSDHPILGADIPENDLIKIANALIPHAMKAVAGLYRLFWIETHPINILSPTQSSPAFVGSISNPRKINIEVAVTSET